VYTELVRLERAISPSFGLCDRTVWTSPSLCKIGNLRADWQAWIGGVSPVLKASPRQPEALPAAWLPLFYYIQSDALRRLSWPRPQSKLIHVDDGDS
jgi:hypothetical protein